MSFGIDTHLYVTYRVVKIGDRIAPYWARLAEVGSDPSEVGERHRIQIPHQHIILNQFIELPRIISIWMFSLTLRSKVGAESTSIAQS